MTTAPASIPRPFLRVALALVVVLIFFAYPRVWVVGDELVHPTPVLWLLCLPLVVFGILAFGLVRLLRWIEPAEPGAAPLAWSLALGILTLSPFASNTSDIKTFVFRLVIFTAAGMVCFRPGVVRIPRGLGACLGVYLMMMTISAFLAPHRPTALRFLADQIMLAGWFLLFSTFGIRSVRFIAGMLSLIAATAGIYGILQFLGLDPVTWRETVRLLETEQHLIRPYSVMGNPNLFGTLMIIGFCLSAASGSIASGKTRRVFACAKGVCLIGLFVSFSRGAWLTSAALLFIFWALRLRRQSPVEIFKANRTFLLAAGGVTAVVCAAYADTLLVRLGSFFEFDESFASRLYLYQSAIRLFLNHPWVGCGPDHFMYLFGDYISADFFRIYPPSRTVLQHAHNEYLQMLAETGFITTAAFLGLGVGVVRLFFKRMETLEVESRTVYLGVFFALLGLLFQAAFNMDTRKLAFQAVLWALLGLLLSSQPRPDSAGVASRLVGRFGILLVSPAIAAIFFLQPMMSSIYTELGMRQIRKTELGAAGLSLQRGLRLDPVSLQAMDKLAFVGYASGDYPMAVDLLTRIHSRSATFSNNAGQLGLVLLAAGDPDRAREYFQKAETIEPHNPQLLQYAARCLLELNEPAPALQRLESAAALDTPLVKTAEWNALMAKAALAEGRVADAQTFLDRASALNPSDPTTRFVRIQLAGALGKMATVVSELTQPEASAGFPHVDRMRLLPLYEQALSAAPSDSLLYPYLKLCLGLREHRRALDTLERRSRNISTPGHISFLWGILLERDGRVSAARERYIRAISSGGDFAQTLFKEMDQRNQLDPGMLEEAFREMAPVWNTLDDTVLIRWYEIVETARDRISVPVGLYKSMYRRFRSPVFALPAGRDSISMDTGQWTRCVRLLTPAYLLTAYRSPERAERGSVFPIRYRIQKIAEPPSEWPHTTLQQKMANQRGLSEDYRYFLRFDAEWSRLKVGEVVDVVRPVLIPRDFPGTDIGFQIRALQWHPDRLEPLAFQYHDVLTVPLSGPVHSSQAHARVSSAGRIVYQTHPNRPELLWAMAERLRAAGFHDDSEQFFVFALSADSEAHLPAGSIVQYIRNLPADRDVQSPKLQTQEIPGRDFLQSAKGAGRSDTELGRKVETLIRLARSDAAEMLLNDPQHRTAPPPATVWPDQNIPPVEAASWIRAGPYFRFAFAPSQKSESEMLLVIQRVGRMPDHVNLAVGLYTETLDSDRMLFNESLMDRLPKVGDAAVVSVPIRSDLPYVFLWPYERGRYWAPYPWILIPGTYHFGWTETILPISKLRAGLAHGGPR